MISLLFFAILVYHLCFVGCCRRMADGKKFFEIVLIKLSEDDHLTVFPIFRVFLNQLMKQKRQKYVVLCRQNNINVVK